MNNDRGYRGPGGGGGQRPPQNQGGQYGHGGGRPHQPEGARRDHGGTAPPDVAWVEDVIKNGNYKRLDDEAKRIGEDIADESTKTQLRGLFGTVKQLEFLTGVQRTRALAMLRPRVAYAAARADGKLTKLCAVLTEASRQTEENPGDRTQRFVDLMEAILCYSTAAKKKNKGNDREVVR